MDNSYGSFGHKRALGGVIMAASSELSAMSWSPRSIDFQERSHVAQADARGRPPTPMRTYAETRFKLAAGIDQNLKAEFLPGGIDPHLFIQRLPNPT